MDESRRNGGNTAQHKTIQHCRYHEERSAPKDSLVALWEGEVYGPGICSGDL